MERKILAARMIATGYGTHKYDVKYQGEWEDMDLVTAIDNRVYDNPTPEQLSISHYGGYVKKIYEQDGITRAEVGVYYD